MQNSRIDIQLLLPATSLVFVSATNIEIVPPHELSSDEVGEKAYGLSCLPPAWTLPFFVISKDLHCSFLIGNSEKREIILNRWLARINQAANMIGLSDGDQIIVRSSGCAEGLKERGKFHSVCGNVLKIHEAIQSCLQKLVSDSELTDQQIPIVIQKLAVPLSAKGHLSNERRCSKENRDWLGEFEKLNHGRDDQFKISLRNWRKKYNYEKNTNELLQCNLKVQISEVLKLPAAWVYARKARLHFEWVWDGKVIYLVQADQDNNKICGVDPKKLYCKSGMLSTAKYNLKCLSKINEELASRYNKIKNVYIYLKLSLPTTPLYILDNQEIIDQLCNDILAPDLESDLILLLGQPLVIRMDIESNDIDKRQLLPRTEVRDINTAINWIIDKAKLKKQEYADDIVFIMHNFIPAFASAFAYAVPGERNVQIESLWGLPEGLYYNAHDKFIVDTQKRLTSELSEQHIDKFDLHESVNYKHYFFAPDQDGQWTTQILQPPYDWRPSIPSRHWVKEIAYETRRITEEVGEPLSIMWFVGVPKSVCAKPVFPWHHEPHDPQKSSRIATERTKTPYDETRVIRTYADIDKLADEANKDKSTVCRIRIQPTEEKLIRDKDTLKKIGELARKLSAVIMLEGGILSHAYYQLVETNAIVEVMYPFTDFDYRQEFNKLVRDKVPSNIERGGEIVSKARLAGEALLRALREKLTEEAFEVLDAFSQDSIVSELADVIEVVDAILKLLKIDRDELFRRQKEKKEKAGGFDDGIVLLKTFNPLPSNKKTESENELFESDEQIDKIHHKIEKWSDKRVHPAAVETKIKIEIPFVMDNWASGFNEAIIDKDSGISVTAKLTGKRVKSISSIELSIYHCEQPSLFK